jgi:hypothetical protein
MIVSGKATEPMYDCLIRVLILAIHFGIHCRRHVMLRLKNPHNISPILCCEMYIAVHYSLLRYSM